MVCEDGRAENEAEAETGLGRIVWLCKLQGIDMGDIGVEPFIRMVVEREMD